MRMSEAACGSLKEGDRLLIEGMLEDICGLGLRIRWGWDLME